MVVIIFYTPSATIRSKVIIVTKEYPTIVNICMIPRFMWILFFSDDGARKRRRSRSRERRRSRSPRDRERKRGRRSRSRERRGSKPRDRNRGEKDAGDAGTEANGDSGVFIKQEVDDKEYEGAYDAAGDQFQNYDNAGGTEYPNYEDAWTNEYFNKMQMDWVF